MHRMQLHYFFQLLFNLPIFPEITYSR